jgi:hypothetical protein
MYIKLNEDLYNKIKAITFTDYEAIGDFIPSESIEPMLEDLLLEIDRLQEKYNDLEQNINDNYRAITPAEMYGITDKDFI